MRIAVTGSSGFVGNRLTKELRSKGHEVLGIGKGELAGGLGALLAGAGAVVNLAGAPIIKRWTEAHKREMYESRIMTTRALVSAISAMGARPEVLVSTSAVGIYKPGKTHTEYEFEYDSGYLGKLATDWEAEAMRAGEFGVRVVILRFGVVLGPEGGALSKMLPIFRAGLGGTVGSGKQDFPWVHMADVVEVIRRACEDSNMSGAYNLVAPEPLTNKVFTQTLADVLGRPALLRVPEFALRLQYGEGARVLTEGQHVLPKRLMEMGYQFKFSSLRAALEDCVKKG